MNNNEILKSLEEEKTKLESDFTIYTGQLKQLEENMISVEQEYKAKKENLEVNIERVRGAYRVVYDQLKKFGVIKDEDETANTKTEETKQVDKPKTKIQSKKVERKDEVKPSEEKVGSSLSPEDIEKINNVVKKPEVKTVNGNEIPEYLQQEYNK